MCQDFMEVFTDDFSVFGNSFDSYLNNLSMMLARCQETNLVLNWEKCHFMVGEGIVLGHKISKARIKDKKGSKNLADDHLSILENLELEELDEDAIRDSFPDEHLMGINIKEAETDPWYADYAKSLVSKIIPQHLTFHLERNSWLMLKNSYGMTSCPEGIVRQCDFGKESHEILKHCHTGLTGGNYGADITAGKVFKSGFYWPTIFKDYVTYL
nr:hypothetical protein [Tanacetum cinerariifolium]